MLTVCHRALYASRMLDGDRGLREDADRLAFLCDDVDRRLEHAIVLLRGGARAPTLPDAARSVARRQKIRRAAIERRRAELTWPALLLYFESLRQTEPPKHLLPPALRADVERTRQQIIELRAVLERDGDQPASLWAIARNGVRVLDAALRGEATAREIREQVDAIHSLDAERKQHGDRRYVAERYRVVDVFEQLEAELAGEAHSR